MPGLFVVYLIAITISWAGGQNSTIVGPLPLFAWCALLAFGLQWLAFIPAYLKQTEHFYDLVGSISYIACTLLAILLTNQLDARSLLLATFIIIWAARLGSFLFARIQQDGSDSRFDKIKPDPIRFFFTWSLQGLWILITAAAAIAAISSLQKVGLGPMAAIGIALWMAGFAVEVIADRQKRIFRANAGAGQFIQSGLWSRSRHPNYFGEILLWCGIAILALPALSGWQFATLISPLFVYILLTRISGVPLLERKADKKWAGDPDYETYKSRTPILIPRLLR